MKCFLYYLTIYNNYVTLHRYCNIGKLYENKQTSSFTLLNKFIIIAKNYLIKSSLFYGVVYEK